MPIRIAGMAAPFVVIHESVENGLALAGTGLPAKAPASLAPGSRPSSPASRLLHRAGAAPGVDQLLEGALHLPDQGVVVDLPRQPRSAGLLENRAAHGKPPAGAAVGRLPEALGEGFGRGIQAQQHHATAIGVALLDQLIELFPFLGRLRLDLPPRGVDAQVVQALEAAVEHLG